MAAKLISVWVGAGDYFHLDIRCPTVLGPAAGTICEHGLNMQDLADEMTSGGFKYCEVALMADPKISKGKFFTPCPSCVVPGMKKAMFGMLGEAKEKQTDVLQVAGSFKG